MLFCFITWLVYLCLGLFGYVCLCLCLGNVVCLVEIWLVAIDLMIILICVLDAAVYCLFNFAVLVIWYLLFEFLSLIVLFCYCGCLEAWIFILHLVLWLFVVCFSLTATGLLCCLEVSYCFDLCCLWNSCLVCCYFVVLFCFVVICCVWFGRLFVGCLCFVAD